MPEIINISDSGSGRGFLGNLHPLVRNLLLLVFLLGASIAIALLIINNGSVIGYVFLALFIGLPIVWIAFNSPLQALNISIVLASLVFVIRRVSGMYELPVGTAGDAILLVGALGVLFKKRTSIQPVKNVISITFGLAMAYVALQILNPNVNTLDAWLNLGLRNLIIDVSIFVLSVHAFTSKANVKNFLIVFIGIAFIAALYGIYQEWAGLPNFDLNWVMADEQRFKLFFINGAFRKWSIYSAVSSFGVIMAYTAIISLILAVGPFKVWKRVLLVVAAFCMMAGMLYSGTRTAYVMLPVGVVFFIMLTIRERRTIVFAVFAFLIGGGIFFGPFYGGSLSRMRTAFQPDKDASMQVREINRARIQPYMWSHPIGGGIGTTGDFGKKYHPGHPLAGFPPDSGYMLTVLETGYIGLLLTLWLYLITMIVGVKNFFKTRDPAIRYYYAAFMAAFFAITFGNIAQNAVSYPPLDIVNICILVLMFRLHYLDQNPTISTTNENI